MPETQYEFTALEQDELTQLRSRLSRDSGLFACDAAGELLLDSANRPVGLEYVVLRSRRYLMDHTGKVWRFFAEGTRKDPSAPDGGGAPWRNNRVEMWNGRWRRVAAPDGTARYEKMLVTRPLDKRINGHPGMSQIDFYCQQKHYRHPQDEPHEPTSPEREDLDTGRRTLPAAPAVVETAPGEPAGKNRSSRHGAGSKNS